MYRTSLIILYYDQQIHNYFTNYDTPTRFDTNTNCIINRCIWNTCV